MAMRQSVSFANPETLTPEFSASTTPPAKPNGVPLLPLARSPIDPSSKSSPAVGGESPAPPTIASTFPDAGTFEPISFAPATLSLLSGRVPTKCPTCSTVGERFRSRLKGLSEGTPLFCSRKCQYATATIALTCEGCGTAYTKLRCEVEKAKRKGFTRSFCTRTCFLETSSRNAHERAMTLIPEQPIGPVISDKRVLTESGRRRYYTAEVAALTDGVNRKRPCLQCGTIRKSKNVMCRPCYLSARASTYLTLTCTQCSSPFVKMRAERESRERAGQTNAFCRFECHHQWMREHPSGRCGRCEKPFKVDNAKRFCSDDCRLAVRDERRESKNRPCPQCGVVYIPRGSRQQFCDRICADQAHSERMIGMGNSHYKDGTSYAEWFRQMRPLILERDGSQCRVCSVTDRLVPTGRSDHFQWKSLLAVHHLNEDPADNRPGNLILICSPCHMRHHKSATTPYPWFATYAENATRSMTSRWTATVTSLQMKFSSTTA